MLKKSLKLFSAVVFAAVAVVCLSSSVESGENSRFDSEERDYFAAVKCSGNSEPIEIRGKCCKASMMGSCHYVDCEDFSPPNSPCPQQ